MTLLGQLPDVSETRIPGDRPGPRPHELHAVVVFGIVTGSDHDATPDSQVGRGEINFLGAALTDIQHIDTRGPQAIDQRHFQSFTGESNVMPHHHTTGIDHLGVSTANAVGDILV